MSLFLVTYFNFTVVLVNKEWKTNKQTPKLVLYQQVVWEVASDNTLGNAWAQGLSKSAAYFNLPRSF